MKSLLLLLVFMLFLSPRRSHAKIFDDAKACIKHPKLPSFLIKSFTIKFTSLLPEGILDINKLFNTFKIINSLNSIINHSEINEKIYKTPSIVPKINQFTELSSSYDNFNSVLKSFATVNGDKTQTTSDDLELRNFIENDVFSNQIETLKVEILKGVMNLKQVIMEGYESFERNDIYDEKIENFGNLSHAFEELKRIQQCLKGYEDTQFEDGIQWFSCFFLCKDLRNITSSLLDHFNQISFCQKSPWLRDVIIRLFMQLFSLDRCHFEVLYPKSEDKFLELHENNPKEEEITLKMHTLPGVYCFPAQITSHISEVVTKIFKYVFKLEEYCQIKVEVSTGSFIQNFKLPFRLKNESITLIHEKDYFDDNNELLDVNRTIFISFVKNISEKIIPYPKCHTGEHVLRIATKTHDKGFINKDTGRKLENQNEKQKLKEFNLKKKLAYNIFDIKGDFLSKEKEPEETTMGHIKITEKNWNQTFTIPVKPVVTHKYYHNPYENVNISIKLVSNKQRINSTKIMAKVINRPPFNHSVCQSINDPHITTFDGLYYNNIYQGYFVLYKHKSSLYEVQVIYQGCGSLRASCTCGVAVRAVDDVFVVDRCRRSPLLHHHMKSNSEKHLNDGAVKSEENGHALKVKLFQNGPLTKAFRLFKKDEGLSYQIILPHGSIVTIEANGQSQLNTWVFASAYDFNQTSGLCGLFNGQETDDLTHSDGSTSPIEDARKIYPKQFIESWRIKNNESAFEGVLPDNTSTQDTSQYCRCVHDFMTKFHCKCSYNHLTETCDLDLGDEWTGTNVSSLVVPSIHQDPVSADATDKIDLDESYEPNFNLTGQKLVSKVFCTKLLMVEAKSIIIKSCFLLTLLPLDLKEDQDIGISEIINLLEKFKTSPLSNAVKGCVDDIDITGTRLDLVWKLAAISAAKKTCLYHISSRHSSFYRVMRKSFKNDSCINECYFRGTCGNGVCHCDEGYNGPDCSIETSNQTSLQELPVQSLAAVTFSDPLKIFCNVRNENCSYIKLSISNYDAKLLTCYAKQAVKTSLDHVTKSGEFEIEKNIINPNQFVCILPASTEILFNQEITTAQKYDEENFLKKRHSKDVYKTNRLSHEIKVVPKEVKSQMGGVLSGLTRQIDFVVYDSVCQVCYYVAGTCVLKKPENYCIIDGLCVGEEEEEVWDSCFICNTSVSNSFYSLKQSKDCIQRENEKVEKEKRKSIDLTIRITCSVIVSIIIIVVTILMFIKEKTSVREGFDFANHQIFVGNGEISYTNKGYDMDQVIEDDISRKHLEDLQKNPEAKAHKQNLDSELRSRTRAESTVSKLLYREPENFSYHHHDTEGELYRRNNRSRALSETSHGLGGGGPMLFGGYNRASIVLPADNISASAYHGIGGHGTSLFPTSIDKFN